MTKQKKKQIPKNTRAIGKVATSATVRGTSFLQYAVVTGVGLLLCYLFWWPLFQGGGLIGGDLYPYFFPQKAVLADSLKAGEIPFWNPLVGFGYPVLGESQTAALYPPNLILYSTLSINSAYNASQILHYLLAFIATFALAKSLGLRTCGALLTALCFVFGWFAPRICLEWAIIGGAWFSAILWAGVRFLQSNSRKYLVYIALFLGMDLLAGHYNLAFITLLVLFPLPLLVSRAGNEGVPANYVNSWGLISLAVLFGFSLAAVQLLPTWELKKQSQRQAVSEVFAPTYGHMPPASFSQLIKPWKWHAGEQTMDQLLQEATSFAVPTATNKAEANIYIGLLPIALIALALSISQFRKELMLANHWGWLFVAVVGLVFATGWPTYYLQNFPGIGFFRGPGRYSVVTAISLSILAGASFDAIARSRQWAQGKVATISILLFSITAADLWAVSREYEFGFAPYIGRQVFYATLIDHPPIEERVSLSHLKDLERSTDFIRVYAPGANIPTLMNVSALPVYLGLGPEIYETGQVRVDWSLTDPVAIQEAMDRMRAFGVSYLILENPLDDQLWPVTFIGRKVEPLLNRTLARQEPYFYYTIKNSRGTVYFKDPTTTSTIKDVHITPNKITIEANCDHSEQLVLTQLNYPGWKVLIDGNSALSESHLDLFRMVSLSKGKHTIEWVYRSNMIRLGACLSLLGGLLLSVIWWRIP